MIKDGDSYFEVLVVFIYFFDYVVKVFEWIVVDFNFFVYFK